MKSLLFAFIIYRHNFKSGHIIPKESIAFTDPTVDGRDFAVSYCGTPNFLIYR